MAFNLAATRTVNPPGATPVLTEAQVWAGLNIKARNPKPFVAAATYSELAHDTPNKVTRRVKFGEDAPFVTEEIDIYESAIMYFEASLGSRVTNILSYGPSGELLLTFAFANGVPGVAPGDTKPTAEIAQTVGAGVEHSIETIRQMVVDGTIKAK